MTQHRGEGDLNSILWWWQSIGKVEILDVFAGRIPRPQFPACQDPADTSRYRWLLSNAEYLHRPRGITRREVASIGSPSEAIYAAVEGSEGLMSRKKSDVNLSAFLRPSDRRRGHEA